MKTPLILFAALAVLSLNAQKSFDERPTAKRSNAVVAPEGNWQTIKYNPEHTTSGSALLMGKTSNGLPYSLSLKTGGSPHYFWGTFSENAVAAVSSLEAPSTTLKSYLKSLSQLKGIKDCDFQLLATSSDSTYAKWDFIAQYQGIPIYGSQTSFIKTPTSLTVVGSLYPVTALNITPLYTEKAAVQLGFNALGKSPSKDTFWITPSWGIASSSAELVLYPGKNFDQPLALAWMLTLHPNVLERYFVFIDAQSGAVLNYINATCEVNGPATASGTDLNGKSVTLNTYEYNGRFYLINASKPMFNASASQIPNNPVGALFTLDAQNGDGSQLYHISNTTNSNWTSKAVSAHDNASIAFDYYKNTHTRNSIDGNGGTITSVINITDGSGEGFDNAYWNGSFMAYGNGNVAFKKPLQASLDVAGHEMTHGVVEKTANLVYQSQSGAINESMADIFGAMMDRDDWKIGEDITSTSYIPSGALRDMSDPHNGRTVFGQSGYQPRHMNEYYSGSADNYGVHYNSGIPNWAYYKIATSIGKNKAEKIYYRTLALYLTSNSKFLDLRYAVEKATQDLYGANTELTAVKTAFDEVGIYDPNAGSGGGGGSTGAGTFDLPANTGNEYILCYNTDIDISGTLYASTTVPDNFTALSTTEMKRRPSLTDDGKFGYYVKLDGTIWKIDLVQATESQVQSQPIWSNVAISKDGSKLACITASIDTSIWVYHFSNAQWKKFKLYNPTYSGQNAAGVLYADAIEWDYAGENIIYDAKNVVTVGVSESEYWDISTIKIWNNRSNNWADGKVQKLFNQLPENISVGNPTYSKNSPHIIAFDYIDAGNGTYAAVGMNLATNATDVIVVSDRLTWPAYSRLDNFLLYDDQDLTNGKTVSRIPLASNKIKSASTGGAIIAEAQWGQWLTLGTRRLRNNEKDLLTFGFPGTNPPSNGVISGTNITVTVPSGTNLASLTPTFTHSAASVVWVGTAEQISGTGTIDFTNQVTYRVQAQDLTFKNYTVKVTVNNTQSASQLQWPRPKLYPNPAADLVMMEGEFDQILVKDLSGRIMKVKISAENGKTLIHTAFLPAGTYLISAPGHTSDALVVIAH